MHQLVLPRCEGGRLSFAAYTDRVLLVDLFATWTVESMLQIPGYQVLEGKYQDQGLSVVGISFDTHLDLVPAYVKGMQISYPVVLADPSFVRGLGPFGPLHKIPHLFLFDGDGKIRGSWSGKVDLRAVEQAILPLLP